MQYLAQSNVRIVNRIDLELVSDPEDYVKTGALTFAPPPHNPVGKLPSIVLIFVKCKGMPGAQVLSFKGRIFTANVTGVPACNHWRKSCSCYFGVGFSRADSQVDVTADMSEPAECPLSDIT